MELMKQYLGLDHLWLDSGNRISEYAFAHVQRGEIHWAQPIFAEAGPLGVVFFFVLSGFLITYLLLAEKQLTKTVGVGAFYMRRILRIWPLYFFIFILGFFVLPHFSFFEVGVQSEKFAENFWGNFWCYLFFLPNLAYSLYMAVPCIGHSWSIGVEEQFYLIWPVIMKFAKRPLKAILMVTGVLLLLKSGVLVLDKMSDANWIAPLKTFVAMSKIECMTLGGLGAYILFYKKENILRWIHSRTIQIAAFAMIPFLLYFFPAKLQDGVHLLYSLCFLVIMMNVSGNKKSLVKLENNAMNLLGKISYGIYMYHLMCVVFVLHFFKYLNPGVEHLGMANNILVYAAAILLTIVVSYFSYHIFESRFIRMKKNLTRVLSGDEAR